MDTSSIQSHINKYRKKHKVTLLELAQYTHFTYEEILKIDKCTMALTMKQLKEVYDAINKVVLMRVRRKYEVQGFQLWITRMKERGLN